MSADDAVLVYGATGLTGELVVRALRAQGARPLVGGRHEGKLRALAARHGLGADAVVVARADDPVALSAMVERVRAVVSCAGPFLEVGEPVAAACATHGVFYADSTGEAAFVELLARRYDATARAQGCALAPSLAFEVAVGDAAAARAAEGLGEQVDVEVAYAVAGGATSPGTRASIALVLTRGGLAYTGGALREEPVGAVVREVRFAPPLGAQGALSFPSPEVLTIPRHVPARSVRAFMRVKHPAALRLAARALTAPLAARPVAAAVEPFLRRLLERAGPATPSPEVLSRARFQVVATATARDGARSRRVTVTGSNPYGLSGVLLADAALAMARGQVSARGVIAPTQVLGAERVFERVREFDGGAITLEEPSLSS